MNRQARNRLGWLLSGIFAFAMIMATGPGVLLVNRAEMFFGVPWMYLWAVIWYFVLAAVIVTAYLFVWREPDESSEDR